MKPCKIYSVGSLILLCSLFGGCSPSSTSDSSSSSSRSVPPSADGSSSTNHQLAATAPTSRPFADRNAEIPGTIEA